VADGAKVKEWRNVANICYQGFTQVAAETGGGYDTANDCTYAKKSNTQAVPFGNNKHVEALSQGDETFQPIYKKNVLNGHGSHAHPRCVAPCCAGSACCGPLQCVLNRHMHAHTHTS